MNAKQNKKPWLKIAVAIVVVILVLAAWLKLAGVAHYKNLIQETVSAATGCELVIEGDVKIKLWPLSVSVQKARLRNPAEFSGLGADLAYVDEALAGLKLVPLITRNFVFKDITLKGLNLNLGYNKSDRANWNLGLADTETKPVNFEDAFNRPALSAMFSGISFNQLKVYGGRVVYKDLRPFGGVFEMDAVELSAGPFNNLNARLNFEFSAKTKNVPLKMRGYTTNTLAQILNADWPRVQLNFIETGVPGF